MSGRKCCGLQYSYSRRSKGRVLQAIEGVLLFVVIIAIILGLVYLYERFLLAGMATRVVVTTIPVHQIRDVFVRKVAGTSWKIVDDGNPMIAQSSLLTGIRQQIGLEVSQDGGRNTATIEVLRWTEKYGLPSKGYTLRMRLGAFVNELQRLDPGAQVTERPLKND